MKKTVLILGMLIILLSACAPQPTRTPKPTLDPLILTQIAPTGEPTTAPTMEIVVPTDAATDAIQPTMQSGQSTGSPVLSGFVITAARGNLTIHRGPGLEYNLVGYFLQGQSYNVIGRDAAGKWLMVSLGLPVSTAWISNMTSYTDVNGNIPGLPVIQVDAAVPAYIYNCTDHKLYTKPGAYIIEPWSKTQVNPYDFYYVYDQDVTPPDGYHPVVDKVTVTEGETANVHKDGNGNTYTCTMP
jgi:hypothetical protein